MKGFWLLVHFIGFTLWLGGGIATMVSGVTAKSLPPAQRLAAYRLMSAIQRILVGPGALAVVLSGLILSMAFMRSCSPAGAACRSAGLVGALIVLGIVVPTSARLGRLEPDAAGQLPAAFATLRKRQIIAASVAGGLGLLAMGAAAMGAATIRRL